MNRLLILLIAIIISSCTEPTDYEKLQNFYELKSGKSGEKFDSFNYVVAINELGTCINCNNIFSVKIADNLNDNKVLFILSGQGSKVDISAYIDKEHENVIWDYEGDFNDLKIVKKCAILELDNHELISIKEITPDNVEDQANWIK